MHRPSMGNEVQLARRARLEVVAFRSAQFPAPLVLNPIALGDSALSLRGQSLSRAWRESAEAARELWTLKATVPGR